MDEAYYHDDQLNDLLQRPLESAGAAHNENGVKDVNDVDGVTVLNGFEHGA
jgi:hypothetical protein